MCSPRRVANMQDIVRDELIAFSKGELVECLTDLFQPWAQQIVQDICIDFRTVLQAGQFNANSPLNLFDEGDRAAILQDMDSDPGVSSPRVDYHHSTEAITRESTVPFSRRFVKVNRNFLAAGEGKDKDKHHKRTDRADSSDSHSPHSSRAPDTFQAGPTAHGLTTSGPLTSGPPNVLYPSTGSGGGGGGTASAASASAVPMRGGRQSATTAAHNTASTGLGQQSKGLDSMMLVGRLSSEVTSEEAVSGSGSGSSPTRNIDEGGVAVAKQHEIQLLAAGKSRENAAPSPFYGFGPRLSSSCCTPMIDPDIDPENEDDLRAKQPLLPQTLSPPPMQLESAYDDDDPDFWSESTESYAYQLVTNPWFEKLIAVALVLNAVAMGMEADLASSRHFGREPNVAAMRLLDLLETGFCFIFSVEVGMRIIALGWDFWMDSWNIFDFGLVFIQVFERCARISHGTTTIARVVSLLRYVRITRVIRLVRLVEDLRTIMSSITSSMRSLAWTLLLLCLLLYMVSVLLTNIVVEASGSKNEEKLVYWYGSLPRTYLTMFEAIFGGVSWDEAVAPLIEDISPVLGFVFMSYVAFCILVMMNMATGVFVDNAIKNAQEDKDTNTAKHISDLFFGTGEETITYERFCSKINTPDMQEYFKAINVDPSEAKGLYRLLDANGNGQVDADEMVSGCLRLRGNAKALELQLLFYETTQMYEKMKNFQQRAERCLAYLCGIVETQLQVQFDENPRRRSTTRFPRKSQVRGLSYIGFSAKRTDSTGVEVAGLASVAEQGPAATAAASSSSSGPAAATMTTTRSPESILRHVHEAQEGTPSGGGGVFGGWQNTRLGAILSPSSSFPPPRRPSSAEGGEVTSPQLSIRSPTSRFSEITNGASAVPSAALSAAAAVSSGAGERVPGGGTARYRHDRSFSTISGSSRRPERAQSGFFRGRSNASLGPPGARRGKSFNWLERDRAESSASLLAQFERKS